MGLFGKKKNEYTYTQDRENIAKVIRECKDIADSTRLAEFKEKFNRAAVELERTSELKSAESQSAFAAIDSAIEKYNKIITSQDGELDSILTPSIQKVLDAVLARVKLGR